VAGDAQKSDILLLSTIDLHRMQLEFTESYEHLFMQSYKRLEGALRHKIDSIKTCEEIMKTKPKKIDSRPTLTRSDTNLMGNRFGLRVKKF
jgi:hypothetical protein